MTLFRIILIGFLLIISLPLSYGAEKKKKATVAYRKHDIALARFGEGDRQKYLQQAHRFEGIVNSKIVGQQSVARALQAALLVYLEGFGTRTKEPVAKNLMGLPGLGKSDVLEILSSIGIKVVRIDIQSLLKSQSVAADIYSVTYEARISGQPFILLFDEIDKIPELTAEGFVSDPFVGVLNEILTAGEFNYYSNKVNLKNAMVLTAMNLSPELIDVFLKDAFPGQNKNYYDLTIDDYEKFHQWIVNDHAAMYKILSYLYRTNTVSRLAPNSIVLKPLNKKEYMELVQMKIRGTIARVTSKNNNAARLGVTVTPRYEQFVYDTTVVAASGARETVYNSDGLTAQLIGFGSVYDDSGKSLDRPRNILLDFNSDKKQVEVTVIPQTLNGRRLKPGKPFKFGVEYDPAAKVFVQPMGLASVPPKSIKDVPAAQVARMTKKAMLAARYPENAHPARGLSEKLGKDLIGLEDETKYLEKRFDTYLARKGSARKQPSSLIHAGFPGIGKTEMAELTAKALGLPIVRINLEEFTANQSDTVKKFLDTLQGRIMDAKRQSKNGKYILLLEELDKIFEVYPLSGAPIDRPVIAVIKDLLHSGVVQLPSDNQGRVDTTQSTSGSRFCG